MLEFLYQDSVIAESPSGSGRKEVKRVHEGKRKKSGREEIKEIRKKRKNGGRKNKERWDQRKHKGCKESRKR